MRGQEIEIRWLCRPRARMSCASWGIEVVKIAGYIAGITIVDIARRTAKAVPYAFTFAVLVPGAFRLVRRGRSAPHKTFRESQL